MPSERPSIATDVQARAFRERARGTTHMRTPKKQPEHKEPFRLASSQMESLLSVVRDGMERICQQKARSIRAAVDWRRLLSEEQAKLEELISWTSNDAADALRPDITNQMNLMTLCLVERRLMCEHMPARACHGAQMECEQ